MTDSERTATEGPAISPDSDTSRLETFADGVMAIAITLLILEVDVPHPANGSLWRALGAQWPSYAAYVVSFLTIGIIWVNHHHMFRLIERSPHMFLVLNVVFLMTIAALPWSTALVAEELIAGDTEAITAATVVYGGTMVSIAVMFNVVWRYASRGSRLLVPGVDPAGLARINRSYLSGPITYAIGTLLALVNPWWSLAIFAALALYWLVPSSGPLVLLAPRASKR